MGGSAFFLAGFFAAFFLAAFLAAFFFLAFLTDFFFATPFRLAAFFFFLAAFFAVFLADFFFALFFIAIWCSFLGLTKRTAPPSSMRARHHPAIGMNPEDRIPLAPNAAPHKDLELRRAPTFSGPAHEQARFLPELARAILVE
jgi:hypothetical protein